MLPTKSTHYLFQPTEGVILRWGNTQIVLPSQSYSTNVFKYLTFLYCRNWVWPVPQAEPCGSWIL